MDYGKIKSDGQIQKQPNPVAISISNPNEEQKKTMADLRGELELVYTEQPPYEPDHQYLTEYWQEETVEGVQKAVQHWEIHEYEPEATSEDYENSLESLGVNTDEEENA